MDLGQKAFVYTLVASVFVLGAISIADAKAIPETEYEVMEKACDTKIQLPIMEDQAEFDRLQREWQANCRRALQFLRSIDKELDQFNAPPVERLPGEDI